MGLTGIRARSARTCVPSNAVHRRRFSIMEAHFRRLLRSGCTMRSALKEKGRAGNEPTSTSCPSVISGFSPSLHGVDGRRILWKGNLFGGCQLQCTRKKKTKHSGDPRPVGQQDGFYPLGQLSRQFWGCSRVVSYNSKDPHPATQTARNESGSKQASNSNNREMSEAAAANWGRNIFVRW